MVLIVFTRLKERLNEKEYQRYMSLLPATIQNRITRFRNWQDAHRSLLGNLLLIEGLKRIGLPNLTLYELSYSPYRKPYFEKVDFNISHSGAFVICAISKENKVGIDVEEVAEIPVDDFDEHFSALEMTAIVADKSLRYFYSLWTQKEAFLKAIGKGLHVPLNQLSVKENTIYWERKKWFLHQIKLDEGYLSHLCVDELNPEIVVKEINFYTVTNNP